METTYHVKTSHETTHPMPALRNAWVATQHLAAFCLIMGYVDWDALAQDYKFNFNTHNNLWEIAHALTLSTMESIDQASDEINGN